MADIYDEWQKLCEEHEAARKAYFEAFSVVNVKFVEVARGRSSINPTINEIDALDVAWNAWESVKQRMSEFVRTHV
ncbi:hypothetical protein ACFL1R_07120 [Candidatus Latescibacterota bacterium]